MDNRIIPEDTLQTKAAFIRDANYFGVNKDIGGKYIETLVKHIDCVSEAGYKLGIVTEQLVIHDHSKWSAAEFPGYAMHFKGGGAPELFAPAWLHHIHHNPHHWQHWIFPDGFSPPNSNVENGAVEIPHCYALEMVADWMGASKAYTGHWDMTDWLVKNMGKVKVHSKTAEVLRGLLDGLGYADIVYTYCWGSEL